MKKSISVAILLTAIVSQPSFAIPIEVVQPASTFETIVHFFSETGHTIAEKAAWVGAHLTGHTENSASKADSSGESKIQL